MYFKGYSATENCRFYFQETLGLSILATLELVSNFHIIFHETIWYSSTHKRKDVVSRASPQFFLAMKIFSKTSHSSFPPEFFQSISLRCVKFSRTMKHALAINKLYIVKEYE